MTAPLTGVSKPSTVAKSAGHGKPGGPTVSSPHMEHWMTTRAEPICTPVPANDASSSKTTALACKATPSERFSHGATVARSGSREDHLARMRLSFGSWVTAASPSASINGGTYIPKRPR